MNARRTEGDRSTLDDPSATAPLAAQSGSEFLIDAFGCDPSLLGDLALLRETCEEVVRGLRLRVIGEPQWAQFPTVMGGSQAPGGVTGLYLLAESHLTCHTFPESRLATLNLYRCRSRGAWDWESLLRRRLGAAEVIVRSVPRGSWSAAVTRPEGDA
jgi:S-adenosylmethionine decarboxylase